MTGGRTADAGAWLVPFVLAASALTLAQSGTGAASQPPVDERLRALQAEADRLAREARTLLTELRALEVQRRIAQESVRKADASEAAVAADVARTTARLETLQAQRLATSSDVTERLVELYKRGRPGYARLLLQADLRAVGRLARGAAAVARLDRLRFENHRQMIAAERRVLEDLEARRVALADARTEASRAHAAAADAVRLQNRRIDELDRRRDEAAQYVGELLLARRELERQVDAAAPDPVAGLPIAPLRGAIGWPVAGRLLTRFGRGVDNRSGSAVIRNGIEIATTDGTAVRAVHDGAVTFAAPFTGFGDLVIVDHGAGAFSLYGHLQEISVAQGVRVARGDVVGLSGRTPTGTSGLYFELRIDGRPVDPVQWLRSRP